MLKLLAAAVMLKVGFVCESCPMLGFYNSEKKVFSSNGGVFNVCGFCHTLSVFRFKNFSLD